ncbi:MAG: Fe(3+) ABC transporter substrate-binding protein [Paracoccaceae bacterium]|jgi:iron(III) transport system substrate-binding protein|nr:Fe(3+) ABC transporter substrate-binding protein [Paracoccaceae bacterium]
MSLRVTAILASVSGLALCTGAALAQEVNVYSHRQPELVQPLFDAFTAQTGIAVNVAFVNKGMAERLKAEGARSPADLVMTVDIARLAQVVAAGVTQPVISETLNTNIPAAFRDADNQWFGLTSRARVVFASKDRVADGAISTYEDLADPKWQGRICSRAGTHDYNLALLAAVIDHHGAQAARAWATGLHDNLAKRPEGGDRDQVKSIWAGECDISLGNTYYMGEMMADPDQRKWADSVRIIFPTFAEGGTHVNISGMAMTKSAPHREDALKLMEFLTSEPAQKIYAEINHEFPLRTGVARSELVESWGSFTPDTANLAALAAHRPQALKLMEEINFDG